MDCLVGRTITGILVESEYQEYITIETDKGPFHFEGDGDCCSVTYIAEIKNLHYVLCSVVTEVEELPMTEGEGTRQDEDKIYGYKIRAANGKFFMLVFRNSSNGYYSGSLNLIDNVPDNKKWTRVLKDFEAD